ncbi:unnamed protein product [Enterobius vermicularis]|uniref:G_PROTEIN_RECEP_F1_2 domain-containing protein n=1 Tax=Enterobius vermicularis TaxID=51028 RepID=A0A158Q9X6_ENTVE|nr:unnamed protein product [Enterobius vermicularis]
MAIAGFYALLFILGTCGNSAILAVVHHVRGSDCRARHNTTLIYICVLSVVDFISMLPLPTTIIDQILGFWMFGTFTCKLFRLFEHIGKIFSTFILVCLSFDRYCAVCHPLQVKKKIFFHDFFKSFFFLIFKFFLSLFLLPLQSSLMFILMTPYWISVLYSLYLEIFLPPDEAVLPSPAFIYFMYGVHALPYINSASNFILYGLLNRQVNSVFLVQKYRKNCSTRQLP